MLKMPNIRIGKERNNSEIFKVFLPEVPHPDKQLAPEKGKILINDGFEPLLLTKS